MRRDASEGLWGVRESSQGLPWGGLGSLGGLLGSLESPLGPSRGFLSDRVTSRYLEGQKRAISEGLFADLGGSQVLKVL